MKRFLSTMEQIRRKNPRIHGELRGEGTATDTDWGPKGQRLPVAPQGFIGTSTSLDVCTDVYNNLLS